MGGTWDTFSRQAVSPLLGRKCFVLNLWSMEGVSMYLKGLDPGTCEIVWSYISAEAYAGWIFGLAYYGTYSFR